MNWFNWFEQYLSWSNISTITTNLFNAVQYVDATGTKEDLCACAYLCSHEHLRTSHETTNMFLDWRDLCTCETRDVHPKSPLWDPVPHIQLSQGRPSTGSIANGYTYVQLNPMDIQWLLLKSKQVDGGKSLSSTCSVQVELLSCNSSSPTKPN